MSSAGILSRQLFCLEEKIKARDHISFDHMTVSISMSNTSMSSFTSKEIKKWKFQKWMTCEPVKVMFVVC